MTIQQVVAELQNIKEQTLNNSKITESMILRRTICGHAAIDCN